MTLNDLIRKAAEIRDYLIVKRGESMLLAFHAEEGDYYLSTEELDKIPTE